MKELGPLDRRHLRSRCVGCTRRKIKCEGGLPCVNCLKKDRKCIPHTISTKTRAVFVNLSAPVGQSDRLSVIPSLPQPRSNPSASHDKFFRHFFSGFLIKNNLGMELDLDTIVSGFQSSPSLYNAILALGASEMSKTLSRSTGEKQSNMKSTSVALEAYRTSVVKFQAEIDNKSVFLTESSLWTTFFLGLFELMYDVTGEGWVRHILYGTSKILQVRGPAAHLAGSGRCFFLTIRLFEICRSLIYSEPTFLFEEDWMDLTRQIRIESNIICWHPKEELFDLMIACSSISHRVSEVLEPNSTGAVRPTRDALIHFTIEGHNIRTALGEWYRNFQQWQTRNNTSTNNSQSILAATYFHAISIYLSGIFDYRADFLGLGSPTLPQNMIQSHVDEILHDTATALTSTNLGGLLLFFPLRVAGARVTTIQETETVLTLLEEISRRGFVVADAFGSDLRHLWGCKGIPH